MSGMDDKQREYNELAKIPPTPRVLTMDEVYRWMVSNPLTAKDMLAEIEASKELGLDPDSGREDFCNAKPVR